MNRGGFGKMKKQNHSPKEQKEVNSGHRTPETKPATVPADNLQKK